jgi:bifunctional non-homologous end joining protein LigD
MPQTRQPPDWLKMKNSTAPAIFVVHLKRLAFFFAPPSNSARQAGLRHRRHDEKVFLYAFDLIELNGDDLRRDPLEGRKETLAMMLAKTGLGIRFNEHMEGDGETVFRHACKLGLEGIISKRKDSPYRSGRSPDWLKMKNANAPAVKREEEEEWGNKKRR